LMGGVMILEAQLFMWPWAVSGVLVSIGLFVTVPLAILFRRRFFRCFVRRDDDGWRLTRLMVALLLAAALWLHYLFDLNPFVALLCAISLLPAWPRAQPLFATMPARDRWLAAGWVVFFGAWLLAARDFADRAAVVLWALTLLALHRRGRHRLGLRDRRLLLVLAIVPANVFAAVLPIFVPAHGGRHLGKGLAYDFCEVPKHGLVFATVPSCTSVDNGYDRCKEGRVVAYDSRSLEQVASYDFFSPDYFGRLELLLCLDDEVQVAVQATRYH